MAYGYMSICDTGHEQVVYIDRNCPVCEAMDRISELEKDIEELEKDIEKLREEQYEISQVSEEYRSIIRDNCPEWLV